MPSHSDTFSSPTTAVNLSLLLKSIGEATHVVGKITLVAQELNIGAINLDTALLALSNILLATEGSEAPVLGHNDLLATGELLHNNPLAKQSSYHAKLSKENWRGGIEKTYLILRPPQSLNSSRPITILRPQTQNNLPNIHARHSPIRFPESPPHTRLQPIRTSTTQHLIDTNDMVRMGPDTQMERFFAGSLDHVLVCADTGCFEGFGGQLLVLVGHEMDAERELVDVGALAAEVEDADFGVGDTAVEARLGVLEKNELCQFFLFCSWWCIFLLRV